LIRISANTTSNSSVASNPIKMFRRIRGMVFYSG
jgi:hypothetical protein